MILNQNTCITTLILPISVTSKVTLKQTNHKTNVHLLCSAKKSSSHTDTAAFSRRKTTRRTTRLRKICCTITHITKTQHCPPKRSKVDDIRIRPHNTHAVQTKSAWSRQPSLTANVAHVITSAHHTGCKSHWSNAT